MFDLWQRRQARVYSRRTSHLHFWATAVTLVFTIFLVGVIGIALLFAWYAKDLPRPDKVVRSEGLSTVILDRNGEKLYDIFEDQNRLPVKWEDVPVYLREATIAIEDKEFFSHQGLSEAGIVRGVIACVILRRCQGGSTLTQQLVKNVLLSQERTLPRKMKEAILAIQIERKYTKDEILQMYLNEAPYGGTAVGVEAGSEYYFGKSVKELGLVESAILAGLPQAPSRYSPFTGDPQAYIWRAEQVLRRMREDGYITAETETQARGQLAGTQFAKGNTGLRAPHFVAYVREQLVDKFGSQIVEGGGLKVTTTLDWKLQEKAQKIVAEEVDKAKYLKVSNGAALILDPTTGEILTMVGSKDYSASDSGGFKFNVATQGLRQPGSAIKPITYAAAFKKGYTASTLLVDADTKYPSGDPAKPEYNPKNYDNKFRGPVQLRFGLGNSINTVTVKVSALVGIRDTLRLAYEMGLSTLAPSDDNIRRLGLSLTLGGGEIKLLELVSAYGVFATGGLRQEPVSILKVENAKGQVLFEHQLVTARRILSTEAAYLISDILSDNEARREVFGPKSYLYIPGKTVAVKTGTTDDKRDNWTIGYTPSVVVGAWVGNNDNSPMHPSLASGVTGAAPIWNRIIRETLKDKPDEPFKRPDNIVELEIDGFGGGLPIADNPKRKERYIKGTEPTGPAAIYQELKISRHDSNKLASPTEIAKGEYETKTFVILNETDPVSSDGKNRWQEAIDAWVASQGDSKYHPPKEVYESADQIAVSIKEPGDHSQINSNDVKVVIEAGSVNEIDKIEIYVDGSKVKEKFGVKTWSEIINVTNGQRKIKARALDKKGNSAEHEINIGINEPYATPTSMSTPASTPTTTP